MGETASWRQRLQQRGGWQGLAVICLFLLVPGAIPSLGWLHFLLPLSVFFFARVLGGKAGLTMIGQALVLSLAVSAAIGQTPITFFAMAFIPAGVMLFYSAEKNQPPVRAGGMAFAVLAAGWVVFWAIYALTRQTNPYADVLASLDASMEAAYPLYLKAANIPADLAGELAASFELMRRTVPRIFPAMMAASGICIIWINMVAANLLFRRFSPGLTPWPEFPDWRLPEPLVWGVIAIGAMLFLPFAAARDIALNGCIFLFFLYFFQGLAVLSTLLRRWNVPTPLKVFIYLLTMIQGYGIFLLAVLGLADVWAGFNKKGAAKNRESRQGD